MTVQDFLDGHDARVDAMRALGLEEMLRRKEMFTERYGSDMLGTKVVNALFREGITTFEQVEAMRYEDFAFIRNFGDKCRDRVKERNRAVAEKADAEKWPEHTKLRKVREDSQVIGEFLEWAEGHDYNFTRTHHEDGATFEFPARIEDALAAFFGIDQAALAEEKEQMLEEIRQMNAPKEGK